MLQMSAVFSEFAPACAWLGIDFWTRVSKAVRKESESIAVGIATNKRVAERVVREPFKPDAENGGSLMPIPMPCKQRRVYAAFFAPWLATEDMPDALAFEPRLCLQ